MRTTIVKLPTSDSGSRSLDWNSLRLLLMLSVPALVMAMILFLWPNVLWVAEIPYTAIGILGSFAAIMLSVFIIARYREKPGILYISAGLMATGIIDGFQSMSPPGSSLFTWLHVIAGLCGSFFFALYVLSHIKGFPLPPVKATTKNTTRLLAIVGSGTIIISAFSLLFNSGLPDMVTGERFTNLAWILNTVPVVLFLYTGINLFYRYRVTGNKSMFLFTAIVIFLFQASEVFYFSTLWGIIWWFWLALRLVVYLSVLTYVMKEYIQTSNSLRVEISERSKAEAALREAENNWRNSFNSLEEALLIINDDYSIANINSTAAAMIGDGIDIQNNKCHQVLYGLESPCDNCPARDTLQSGHITSVDQFFEQKSRHFNVKTVPIFDKTGAVNKFIYLFSDITGRIMAEEKEKMLQRELNLSSRLAAIGEVAAGITHEINNPLTSVIAFAQMLTRRDIPEEMAEAVEVINDGANRIAGIVKKLHTFARRQRPEKEFADINSVISSVIQMRTYEMQNNNIQVLTRLNPDIPRTMANVGQMQQVFLNIIVNAEQAMNQMENKGELLISSTRIDNNIRISITDNGPGISPENIDKLFDPFFTTKDVDGGTGLGLSISYGIIKEHGGTIYANSSPGNGAHFTIDLPIVIETDQSEPQEEESVDSGQTRKARILVIDDEAQIQRALERILTQEGHHVTIISNAKNALEKIKNTAFDLILLDIKMPGMNGIEFYKCMKEMDASLQSKVVCITGDIISPENKAFLNETGVACLTKPFGIDALLEQVKSVVGRRTANA